MASSGGGHAGIGVRENLNPLRANGTQLAAARIIAREKYSQLPVPPDDDRADMACQEHRTGGEDRPSVA